MGATALSQEPVVGPALLPVRGSKRLAQGGTRTACPVWADRQGCVPGQLCRAVAPGECHLAGAKQQQHGKGRECENQQRLFTGVVTGFGLCLFGFVSFFNIKGSLLKFWLPGCQQHRQQGVPCAPHNLLFQSRVGVYPFKSSP